VFECVFVREEELYMGRGFVQQKRSSQLGSLCFPRQVALALVSHWH